MGGDTPAPHTPTRGSPHGGCASAKLSRSPSASRGSESRAPRPSPTAAPAARRAPAPPFPTGVADTQTCALARARPVAHPRLHAHPVTLPCSAALGTVATWGLSVRGLATWLPSDRPSPRGVSGVCVGPELLPVTRAACGQRTHEGRRVTEPPPPARKPPAHPDLRTLGARAVPQVPEGQARAGVRHGVLRWTVLGTRSLGWDLPRACPSAQGRGPVHLARATDRTDRTRVGDADVSFHDHHDARSPPPSRGRTTRSDFAAAGLRVGGGGPRGPAPAWRIHAARAGSAGLAPRLRLAGWGGAWTGDDGDAREAARKTCPLRPLRRELRRRRSESGLGESSVRARARAGGDAGTSRPAPSPHAGAAPAPSRGPACPRGCTRGTRRLAPRRVAGAAGTSLGDKGPFTSATCGSVSGPRPHGRPVGTPQSRDRGRCVKTVSRPAPGGRGAGRPCSVSAGATRLTGLGPHARGSPTAARSQQWPRHRPWCPGDPARTGLSRPLRAAYRAEPTVDLDPKDAAAVTARPASGLSPSAAPPPPNPAVGDAGRRVQDEEAARASGTHGPGGRHPSPVLGGG